MSPISEFDWQPLSALRPLLLAVEGMLEVTTSQLKDLLLAKKDISVLEQRMVARIRNARTQRQSHLALYKLQCERWKTEPLVQHQSQALNKLETALAELETVNQKISSFMQGC